ncbi:MAG: hypothetical protein RL124_41 [Acidobacteriota bacterium]
MLRPYFNDILRSLTAFAWVAQLVEQRTENPCVGGSIPSPGTTLNPLHISKRPHIMAKPDIPKIIQVQKPAPSLDHFQQSLSKEDPSKVFKKILWAVGIFVALLLVGYFIRQSREKAVLAFQGQLSALRIEALGTEFEPKKGEALTQSLARYLPQAEALLPQVPSSQKNGLINLINNWRLVLSLPPLADTPSSLQAWERIQQANQALLLGQPQEAQAFLKPLESDADTPSSWAQAYWEIQLMIDQAQGDAVSARKHLDLYRQAFPEGDEVLKKLRRSIL